MQAVTPHAQHLSAALVSDRDQSSGGRVGVRELRQNLSVYLDRVKQGESLAVTERGQVVALLSPLTRPLSPLERLIAEGRATPATRPLRDLRPRRFGGPDERTTDEVLADQRDERL